MRKRIKMKEERDKNGEKERDKLNEKVNLKIMKNKRKRKWVRLNNLN